MTIQGIRFTPGLASTNVHFGSNAKTSGSIPESEKTEPAQGNSQEPGLLEQIWNWVYDNLLVPFRNWLESWLKSIEKQDDTSASDVADNSGADASSPSSEPENVSGASGNPCRTKPPNNVDMSGLAYIGQVTASEEDQARLEGMLEQINTETQGKLSALLQEKAQSAGVIPPSNSMERLAREVAHMASRAQRFLKIEEVLQGKDSQLTPQARANLLAYKADFKRMYLLNTPDAIESAAQLGVQPNERAKSFLTTYLLDSAQAENVIDRLVEQLQQDGGVPKQPAFYLGHMGEIAVEGQIRPQLVKNFIRSVENRRLGLAPQFDTLVGVCHNDSSLAAERVAKTAEAILNQAGKGAMEVPAEIIRNLGMYCPTRIDEVPGQSYQERDAKLEQVQNQVKAHWQAGTAQLLALAIKQLLAVQSKQISSASG